MTDNQLEKIKRFVEVRKHFRLKQGEIGALFGMEQSNVSALEAGKQGKDILNYIPYILEVELGVNREWFNTGNGNMLLNKETSINREDELMMQIKDLRKEKDGLYDRIEELRSNLSLYETKTKQKII